MMFHLEINIAFHAEKYKINIHLSALVEYGIIHMKSMIADYQMILNKVEG